MNLIVALEEEFGIEFDEELAHENNYVGTSLHLEMQEDPCDY